MTGHPAFTLTVCLDVEVFRQVYSLLELLVGLIQTAHEYDLDGMAAFEHQQLSRRCLNAHLGILVVLTEFGRHFDLSHLKLAC